MKIQEGFDAIQATGWRVFDFHCNGNGQSKWWLEIYQGPGAITVNDATVMVSGPDVKVTFEEALKAIGQFKAAPIDWSDVEAALQDNLYARQS